MPLITCLQYSACKSERERKTCVFVKEKYLENECERGERAGSLAVEPAGILPGSFSWLFLSKRLEGNILITWFSLSNQAAFLSCSKMFLLFFICLIILSLFFLSLLLTHTHTPLFLQRFLPSLLIYTMVLSPSLCPPPYPCLSLSHVFQYNVLYI